MTYRAGRYLNLFGSGVDESAAIGTAYQEYVQKYPGKPGMTCNDVALIIAALETDIKTLTEQRALGVTDRVGARYITAAQSRKADFEKVYAQMSCAQAILDQERDQFLNDQYNQLERVQGLAKETGKATTYLIYGMIGIVVLVAGVIVIRKMRGKK